jgi:type IV secretion system protein VirB9
MTASRANFASGLVACLLLGACDYLPRVEFASGQPQPLTSFVEARPQAVPVAEPIEAVPLSPVPVTPSFNQLRPATAAAAEKPKSLEAVFKAGLDQGAAGSSVLATTYYDYQEGAIYPVRVKSGGLTTLQFKPGETIEDAHMGKAVGWAEPAISHIGPEDGGRELMVLKFAGTPETDVTTDLLVMTDQRLYAIQLTGTPKTNAHAVVAWNYPFEDLKARLNRRSTAEAAAKEKIPLQSGVDPSQLNYSYDITSPDGKTPRWKPTMVFDDGKKTWIGFPPDLGRIEAPALFTLDRNNEIAVVNYRRQGAYYVVDHLIDAAELRMGKEPQEVVRIVRKDRAQ